MNSHLTFCVPDKVEETGLQTFLWVLVHCYMKLSVVDHLSLDPLKTQHDYGFNVSVYYPLHC